MICSAVIDPMLGGRIVGFVMFAAFFSIAFVGLATGTITPLNRYPACHRLRQRKAFWFHVGWYTVISLVFLVSTFTDPRFILLSFGLWVMYLVPAGLLSGQVSERGSMTYTRRDAPATFWVHLVLFALIGLSVCAVAVRIFIR